MYSSHTPSYGALLGVLSLKFERSYLSGVNTLPSLESLNLGICVNYLFCSLSLLISLATTTCASTAAMQMTPITAIAVIKACTVHFKQSVPAMSRVASTNPLPITAAFFSAHNFELNRKRSIQIKQIVIPATCGIVKFAQSSNITRIKCNDMENTPLIIARSSNCIMRYLFVLIFFAFLFVCKNSFSVLSSRRLKFHLFYSGDTMYQAK